ncbi:MAG TPA: hypothetical protein VKU85_06585, partial [bacterium]|nr:hypothetical protein [bacterium]
HFEWAPVPQASYYLIGAVRQTEGEPEPLFRQAGQSPEVDVEIEAGMSPGPGRYAWEVLAFGEDGLPVARGSGEFTVE